MKPWNAEFRSFDEYSRMPIGGLRDVMDFSRALEDLAHTVVQPWSVLPLEDGSTPPGLDDVRQARKIMVGEEGPLMRAWLCAELPVPPIARLVDPSRWASWRLQLDSDGLTDIYADGQLVHKDLFLHGTVDLVPATGNEQGPWLACTLDTTIQNVTWEMARASLSGLKEINDLVRDTARSLRTAASLLLTDNPRVNRFLSGEVAVNRSPLTVDERSLLIDQLLSASGQVDVQAYCAGDLAGFIDSLKRCLDALAPLAEFAGRFHLFLLGVSHMDLAWKWRWPETIECMRGTLADQVEFMEEHDDFTFLESSPPVWLALKERDPELFERLVRFGRKGQFEPAGGMWCEPDCQMLSAESWVRQTLFGQRTAREICGVQSPAGHNTDAFGFTWALPKICAGAEMEAFLTQKLRYNQFTVFEEVLFWWESDDGTRILGVHTYPDHYQEIDPDEMAEAVRIFHVTSGVYSAALLFGIGNHGGGPLPDMFDRIEEARQLTVYPQVHLGGMAEYLEHLKSNEADALAQLPVINDELFLECHHKTYTVQAKVKAANRQAERELYDVEAMSVLGGYACNAELRSAWEQVLFNQFHDILPGTSFPMVYQDVFDDYDRAFSTIEVTRDHAAGCLLGEGSDVCAVNTLPWRRIGLATGPAGLLPGIVGSSGIARDDQGSECHWQRTGEGDQVVCAVPELPAFGVRKVEFDGPGTGACADEMSHGAAWAENRFFRVEFSPAEGHVSSIKLADGVELAGDGVGRLDFLEDNPEGFYQTWNMNLTGREDRASCDRFELVEAGPVLVRFRAHMSFVLWEKKKDFMVPIMWHTPGVDYPTSFFVIDYIVYRDLPYIECVMQADWWEDDIDLKVSAYTTLENTRAFYSIPFGQIERPTRRETPYEKARYEVPGLNWADLTDGVHGMAVLNTGRHGHDALDGRLRLTLLTSPYGGEKVHVTDPLADRGKHEIRYAFYPHAGGPEQGDVARVAMEYEHGPLMFGGGQSAVAVGTDMLAVDPGKILVSSVKQAEDGAGIIVRCYEPKGREVELCIDGPLADGAKRAVNFLEHDVGDVPATLGPHQVVSVKVTG